MSAWPYVVAAVLITVAGATVLWAGRRRTRHARPGPAPTRPDSRASGRTPTRHRVAGGCRSGDGHESTGSYRGGAPHLSGRRRSQLRAEWASLQRTYAGQPAQRVLAADRLVSELLDEVGRPPVPSDDGELPVPLVLTTIYHRWAHQIAQDVLIGEAGTEELQDAMLAFQVLVEELTGPDGAASLHP